MRDENAQCLHMMMERLKEGHLHPVLDINGHGKLVPVFKCSDCHSIFYAVTPSDSPKPVKVI